MRVNIGPIAREKGKSLDVDLTASGEPFEVGGERVTFPVPVRVQAEITNTGRCLVVKGDITTTIESTCDRCLERFQMDLAVPFEVEYFRRGGEPISDELQSRQRAEVKAVHADDDEESFLAENGVLFSGDEIDLSEPVREELTVALPIKWLCREDCAGLCPVCGQNRNLQACNCKSDDIDPRFAALTGLLDVKKH